MVTADNWDGGVQPSSKDVAAAIARIRTDKPFPIPHLDTLLTAEEAFQRVLTDAGATLPRRDAVDERIVRSVRTGVPEYAKDAKVHESPYVKRRLPEDSYRLGIITDPQQVGGLPIYKGIARKDSDGDGIPDEWEKAHGLNPNDPADASLIREDGYMNIEYYSFSCLVV